MNEGLLVTGAFGAFFLAFGVYNWFHPFIASVGLDLRVDPSDLDVVRRTLARVVSLGMALIGLWLLNHAVGTALS